MLLERLGEAQFLVCKKPIVYLIHGWTMMSFGFLVNFISLDYSRLACSNKVENHGIFWLYFVFTSSIFIGACSTHYFIKRLKPCRILFICCGVSTSSLWLFSVVHSFYSILFVFLFIGLSAGIALSTSTHSFLECFSQTNYCILHSLYLFKALGFLFATLMFESRSLLQPTEDDSCNVDLIYSMHHVLGQNKFRIRRELRLDAVCFVFASLQIPLMYFLLTTDVRPDEEDRNREEYEDMEPDVSLTNDTPCLKLVLLSTAVACTSTVLFSVFPFLVFSHTYGSITHCQVFTIFFLWGHVVSTLTADKMAPYFYVGISIIGCGVACCALIFDGGLLLGSTLFGFFLATFHPSLITYIRHTLLLRVDTELILLAGSSFGYLISPIFLALSLPSQSQIFTTFFFFATVLLVFVYVSMLNIQAQLERTKATQDKLKMFIDRFFSGESLLKRTRSIRPLISRLRPNSYKRFRERRALRTRVPTIEITLEPTPQDCNL